MAVKPTQRAYTLRLKGKSDTDSWSKALWQTHEAVNRGARVFGDWLLTLRGGIDHRLADQSIHKSRRKNGESDPLAARRNRRILLALSWLSVESADGAPERYVVASGREPESERTTKVLTTFRNILKSRGLTSKEMESWTADCRDSLCAAIRNDAVWVNRSKAFDAANRRIPSLSRKEVWDMLSFFFNDEKSYLTLEKANETGKPAGKSEKKDLVKKAGQWLSSRFGKGKGVDFGRLAKVYAAIHRAATNVRSGCTGRSLIARLAKRVAGEEGADPLATLLRLTAAPGPKSATRNRLRDLASKERVSAEDLEKLAVQAAKDASRAESNIGRKGHRTYADAILADAERACGFTYLQKDGPARHWQFAVMLDHAARRVSIAHSWQKRAEARRQQLAADTRRQVPAEVEQFLDHFLEERGRITGAAGSVRIRPRAVDGWEEVVKAWSGSGCKTAEDRIAKVRELQSTLDKFGDAALFEALADDDARVVWFRNDRADPEPLLHYVRCRYAQERMRRYKVPAYRHPDPFFHPVFCDYGCSRWDVSFAVHKAAQPFRSASKTVDRLSAAYKATKDKQAGMKAHIRLLKAKKELEAARDESKRNLLDRSLQLETWDGNSITATPLRWQSKRLAADLFSMQSPTGIGISVSRGDRISRAAAGIGSDAAILVLNIFEEENWNGRLQVPRDQLERLGARVQKHGWDAQAKKMLANLRWLLTFSPRLMPQTSGPWPTYARQHRLSEDPAHWPHSEKNRNRNGLARLVLCRLPHLRILSLDLGHRYAAACAVWETLPEKELAKICTEAGRRPPAPADLACHVIIRRDGKRTKTIYRRTGPDMWARLDRQFLIKLQGEDRPCRKASPEELTAVRDFETAVGLTRKDDNPLPSDVVSLMTEALRTARLALRRHGDR
ncbi:MAG: type V CRISPR-associated protein Cas12b, partial [candidate division WOR-3 bacterium]